MLNNIKNKIIENINKGVENSPFLFMSWNLELLNQKIYNFSLDILSEYNVPKVNIFVLKDDGESIKISQIKEFLSKLNSKSSYKLQIFIIENISRLTLQASNSVLKQFEEPGEWNLIFLTNKSESWVLETILSRVSSVDLWLKQIRGNYEFYSNMVLDYLNGKSLNLVSYFFKNKLEKIEYINFLKALIDLNKQQKISFSNELLDELLDDINLVANNNVNAKSVVDKWILLIK